MKRIWVISAFMAVFLWTGFIFYFSSRSPIESESQARHVYNILKKLDSVFDFSGTKIFVSVRTFLSKLWFKDEKKPAIYFVRKSAHFGLYLFLGIFCFIFGIMYSKKLLIGLLMGISLPALIASFDEYSQQFFQRGASLNDVMIDISGATVGTLAAGFLMIVYILCRKLAQFMRSEHHE